MSGRIKQRTKGNTKPSSSGRAAELLSRDGFMGFVGFGDAGSSPDGSALQFVPATTDHPQASVHSDFLVVMKKLSKRDGVTKLKAVQEFGELCKTSDMNAVLGVLKYWPRLYNKLALDIDYRVREATQQAMNQMTTRVGRNFAPHLKSVMGVWLCSQCDTYLPVATAAQNAFNAAFTDSKQAEVLGFCKKEINEYLVDNLMNQTADTLCDADVVDEKDRAAKYVRVIAASMQALGKFLKMVDEDARNQIAHHHTRLTSEKKFWRFGRHKSAQIKAAFFSLISTYCEKQASILESCSSSVCPIVLGSLDEADAVVSGPLWEAVLQLVSNMKDCWKHVNMEKAVLPKFWQFLSNAAYGNAHVVMISVLPFISTLPEEVVSPRSGFAQKLLDKTLDGFKLNKTQQSLSECKAVLSSIMDCIKYFMTFGSRKWQIEINESDVEELRTHVINMLINVVEMSLASKTQMRGSCSLFYERLADFLRGTTEIADIQDQFWQGFAALIHSKTGCPEKTQDKPATFQSVVNLLSCLKTNQSLQETQPSRVRFHEPGNNDDERSKTNAGTKRRTKVSNVDLLYGGRLLATVSKTVCKSLERVWSEDSEADLVLVTELLKEFFSTSLLKDILKCLKSFSTKEDLVETGSANNSELSNLSLCCLNELVLHLLQKFDRKANEKWLSCSVQLLFMLLTEIEESDQKCVFKRVFEINSSPNLMYLVINEIFEAEYYLYLSYVHGHHIGTKFVALLKYSCEETEDKNGEEYLWRTLELCFVHAGLVEFFFSEDVMAEIFHVFHLVLSQGNNSARSNVDSVVQLVEKYFQNIEITANQVKNEALLSEVFADIMKLKLHGSEHGFVSQCWDSLINTAINENSWFNIVLSQIAQQIKDFLCSDIPTTFEKFFVFTEAAVEIVETLAEGDNKNFGKIIGKLSPSETDWDELRVDTLSKSTWAVVPFLDGVLNFSEFLHARRGNHSEHLTSHQMLCLFLSRVFKLRFEKECFPECEEADGNVCKILIEMLWFREHLKQTLHKKDGQSRTTLEIMETNLQPLLDMLTNMSSAALLRRLFAMSKSEGGMWSLTLKAVVAASVKKEELSDVLSDFLMSEKSDHSEQQLQTMECLLQEDSSIYNLKLTVECYSKMLREIDSSNMTGLMFCCCILSSALERWIYLSQDSDIATVECQMTLLEVLKDIKSRQPEITDLLLFSCSLDDVNVSKISLNLAIMRIMRMAVVNYSQNLESELWDMILCSMLDWLQSCQDSDVVSIRVGAMTNHVCRLIEAVGKALSNTTTSEKTEKDANVSSSDAPSDRPLLEKLADEWREFFSVSASGNLLRLWSRVAEADISGDQQLSVCHHRLSETISSACCYLTTENLKEYITSSTDAKTTESWDVHFVGKFSQYLESNFSCFQLTAYRLLQRVIPSLAPPEENEGESSRGDSHDDPCRSPPTRLIKLILRNQTKLTLILSEAEVSFGETLGLEDDSETSHIIRTYLLAWKLLLVHFANSNEELRAEYANYLRREKLLNELLGIVFRMLPKKPSERFAGESSLEEKCLLAEEFVHNLAFETYHDLLRTLPALVRLWWNNLEKKNALVVEKYTTSYISPLLCDKEMQIIQKSTTTYENMEIVTRSSTREVIAYYKIEDISIELIVGLSSSYPLGLISVTSGKRVGVKLNQWRLWVMQLTTFLMHQNGTILDGLLLWKRNVDKKFEGLDDCMICFSVIHGSNYSLPRLSCKTCKKKFHSACLYRWFSTSNNSTCPLCRNLF